MSSLLSRLFLVLGAPLLPITASATPLLIPFNDLPGDYTTCGSLNYSGIRTSACSLYNYFQAVYLHDDLGGYPFVNFVAADGSTFSALSFDLSIQSRVFSYQDPHRIRYNFEALSVTGYLDGAVVAQTSVRSDFVPSYPTFAEVALSPDFGMIDRLVMRLVLDEPNKYKYSSNRDGLYCDSDWCLDALIDNLSLDISPALAAAYTTPVPLPASVLLLTTAFGGIGVAARRRRKPQV